MNTIEEACFFLGLFRGASLDPKENDDLILKAADRINLILHAEREACADVCNTEGQMFITAENYDGAAACHTVGKAIRNRGKENQ